MKIVVKFVLIALSILAVAETGIISGISVDSFKTALIVAVILGVFNVFIRPVLIILTLPISIITFGLFALVINALLFWGVSLLVDGFTVVGFIAAFLGALIVSSVQWFLDKLL
jgi:putative membrane protein